MFRRPISVIHCKQASLKVELVGPAVKRQIGESNMVGLPSTFESMVVNMLSTVIVSIPKDCGVISSTSTTTFQESPPRRQVWVLVEQHWWHRRYRRSLQ